MPKVHIPSNSNQGIIPKKSGISKWLSECKIFSRHSKVKNSSEFPASNRVIHPEGKRAQNIMARKEQYLPVVQKLNTMTLSTPKNTTEKNVAAIISKVTNLDPSVERELLSDASFTAECNQLIDKILSPSRRNVISDENKTQFLSDINWERHVYVDEKKDATLFKNVILTYLTSMNRIKYENTHSPIISYLLNKLSDLPLVEEEIARNFPHISHQQRIAIAFNKVCDKKPSAKTSQNNVSITDALPRLSILHSGGDITALHGINRDVYLDTKNGFGYKLYIPTIKLLDNFIDPSHDLRLNEIYLNSDFYQGQYAKYGKYELTSLVDDIYSDTPTVYQGIKFPLVNGATPLLPGSKIPEQWLSQIREMGFEMGDIKPENFLLIQQNNGKNDLIPIDAKFIGENIKLTTLLAEKKTKFDAAALNTTVRTKRLFNAIQKIETSAYVDISDTESEENSKENTYRYTDQQQGKFIGENDTINLPLSNYSTTYL